MPHDPERYLHDMLDSCRYLVEFTAGRTKQDYIRDRAFRSALERELQIIGEALLQLEKTAPETAQRITEYRRIIGFRHILVHAYRSLEPDTVWTIVEEKLPVLMNEIEELMP